MLGFLCAKQKNAWTQILEKYFILGTTRLYIAQFGQKTQCLKDNNYCYSSLFLVHVNLFDICNNNILGRNVDVSIEHKRLHQIELKIVCLIGLN